jgi:FixJ family two-component response regulator
MNVRYWGQSGRQRAVGFLSKPFDDEALIECLTAAIRL